MPHRRGLAPGARISHKGDNVSAKVRRTGRPARLENYRRARGPIADLARATEWQAAVGAPIVLDGRLWGVIVTSWGGERSPPDDTEEHMTEFAQLLGTAIANADSREQLTASRARLLTAADDARRRVVRDLHDGAQERLVHVIINLKLAAQALPASDDDTARRVAMPSAATRSCASLPTASFRPRSRTVVCGRGSTPSRRDSRCRSGSTCRPSGSRLTSRQVRTSSWRRR
jgi:GAF domain-containing protein